MPVAGTQSERSLRNDVLVAGVILAFTAVPVELRVPSQQVLRDVFSLNIYSVDIAANVLAFIPLGLVLRDRKWWAVVLLAAGLSTFAEATQVFTVDRMPGVIDVVTNVLGAGLGVLLAKRWPILPPESRIGVPHAIVAAMAAVAYVAVGSNLTVEAGLRKLTALIEAPPWLSTNARGAGRLGTVEAHLTFDAISDGAYRDDSPNRLSGLVVNGATVSPGFRGSAISLNGQQWLDLGDPVALRLTGSMTLSAWIKVTRFPDDDAAIISSLSANEAGYQLDVTRDEGPHTIGFKIGDPSGNLMARYGKTVIPLDRWQHVAGVYDAASQTLDVYLNGSLDNGCLLGRVTGRQLPSSVHAFVGRRAGMKGFEFTGSIDEVRIESKASSAIELQREADRTPPAEDAPSVASIGDGAEVNRCGAPPPSRAAGPLVLLGMFVAVVCAVLFQGMRSVILTLGVCALLGVTAVYWASAAIIAEAAWLPTFCVPLGGGIVLAALRMSRADRRTRR